MDKKIMIDNLKKKSNNTSNISLKNSIKQKMNLLKDDKTVMK